MSLAYLVLSWLSLPSLPVCIHVNYEVEARTIIARLWLSSDLLNLVLLLLKSR